MNSNTSRRNFIRTSSTILALPWLESLATAANSKPPKRMVCINTEFGLYGPAFFPEKPGRDYEHSDYTQVLDPLRNDFTVFSGISHPEIGGDHASASCFLSSAKHPRRPGFRNTVSMDFLASKHVGTATRFPILVLNTDGGGGAMTRTYSGAPVSSEASPSRLFAKMFLAGKAKQVEQEIARLRQGKSVLDEMAAEMKSLSRKLGRDDQQQLADYTETVREMERQLHANEEWAQKPKPKVGAKPPKDITSKADILNRTKLMLDMVKLALQTDSTRVCTLFIRGMDLTIPNLPGIKENHHGLTHHGKNPDKIRQLKIVESAQIAVFGKFLQSLKTTNDSEGKLLDHTQVMIGSNLGDASGHGTLNLPILLAGGGHKHGSHIAGDVNDNTPLANLFVTMMQQFGMEVDQFGSSTGTLSIG